MYAPEVRVPRRRDDLVDLSPGAPGQPGLGDEPSGGGVVAMLLRAPNRSDAGPDGMAEWGTSGDGPSGAFHGKRRPPHRWARRALASKSPLYVSRGTQLSVCFASEACGLQRRSTRAIPSASPHPFTAEMRFRGCAVPLSDEISPALMPGSCGTKSWARGTSLRTVPEASVAPEGSSPP